MKAVWNDQVVAEANKADLIFIEGNWYFPPDSVDKQYFNESSSHTVCPWKGTAHYYDVNANGKVSEGGAWYYPELKAGAAERVHKDFTDYVAFWRGVEVTE